MKKLTLTLAFAALFAGSAIAAPASNCWPVTGNWQNAATTNCKKTADRNTDVSFCDRKQNADDPSCKKCDDKA